MSISPTTGTIPFVLKYSSAMNEPPMAAALFASLFLEYLFKSLSAPIDKSGGNNIFGFYYHYLFRCILLPNLPP